MDTIVEVPKSNFLMTFMSLFFKRENRINRWQFISGLILSIVLISIFFGILSALNLKFLPVNLHLIFPEIILHAFIIYGGRLRLHDFNLSGYWLTPFFILTLLSFILGHSKYTSELTNYVHYSYWAINLSTCIVLLLWPGNKKNNKYGVSPRKTVEIEKNHQNFSKKRVEQS